MSRRNENRHCVSVQREVSASENLGRISLEGMDQTDKGITGVMFVELARSGIQYNIRAEVRDNG
jgi:hypothetical protein